MSGAAKPTPHPVSAALTYLAGTPDNAVYVASVGGGEVRPHEGNYAEHTVDIHDARSRHEGFSLDREGFMLTHQPSRVSDFYDDGQIAGIYEQEARTLVREASGARRVEIFDHTRRSASDDIRKKRRIREPAATVHNDYTARSGPQRLLDHFAGTTEDVNALLAGRFAIVNVWRSIAGPVLTAPMALCDATSVSHDDLVPVTRQARDRIGEIQMVLHNPAHRWYHFPRMAMDEALLIKTFDSATDGRTRFTVHTSFEDPGAPPDAPPRESLETRCFAFF